jgi:hypothetical protein
MTWINTIVALENLQVAIHRRLTTIWTASGTSSFFYSKQSNFSAFRQRLNNSPSFVAWYNYSDSW